MATVSVHLDGAIFSNDVAARTGHRYTRDYFVEVESDPSGPIVRLTPRATGVEPKQLTEQFRNDALDELLRERVRSETSYLQTILIQAAMRLATPVCGQGK
jgi:His-Xaa-Ser system protein HxsD